MDVLNQGPRFDTRIGCVGALMPALLGEKVLQYFYQRSVAAHEVDRILLILVRMSKTKTDERLSGAGYARQEADHVLISKARGIDKPLNRIPHGADLMFRSFAVGDVADGEPAAKCNRRLNDARNRRVWAFVPFCRLELYPKIASGDEFQYGGEILLRGKRGFADPER